jgi:hypothetical protein
MGKALTSDTGAEGALKGSSGTVNVDRGTDGM